MVAIAIVVVVVVFVAVVVACKYYLLITSLIISRKFLINILKSFLSYVLLTIHIQVTDSLCEI